MHKNLSIKYYQGNKDQRKRKTKKKWQYGCARYKNLSEDEKNKLVDYRKK